MRGLLLVGLILAASLAVAFSSKAVCRGELGTNVVTANWCYSDIRSLYYERAFDLDLPPYATRVTQDDRLDPPVFEYPPGIGYGAWGIALASTSGRQFLNLTAWALVAAALVTVWQLDVALRRLDLPRRRLLRFAASPTLVVLGMQNWDLWSIAPAAAGLAAAAGRRPRVAAAWFGLAAGVKWWPALLVVPLVVGPWADGRSVLRRVSPALVAAGVWGLVQVPAVVANPRGWWASIAFHLERGPNRASPIGVVANVGEALAPSPFWDGTFVEATTVLTFGVLLAGVAYVGWRLATDTLDPAVASFALVALFLVTSKVVSVQFLLWLLPLAVVARIPYRPVLAADVLNAAVWLVWAPVGDAPVPAFWAALALAAVRSALLAAVLVPALRRHGSAVAPAPVPAGAGAAP